MIVYIQFKQVNSSASLTLPIQLTFTLQRLRRMWCEKSKYDHQWFCFTDVNGMPIPEEGFVGDIIKSRTSKLNIFVEEMCPVRVHVVGYPNLSTSIRATLSTKGRDFGRLLCEKLILPERDMLLRNKNGIIDQNKTLYECGISEGNEILADFEFLIHVCEITSKRRRTIQCYASHDAQIILHPDISPEKQRLYYGYTLLRSDGKVVDTLKDVGGLYWREWTIYLDKMMCVSINRPGMSDISQKCSYVRHVWHMDELKTLFEEATEESIVWQHKTVPLTHSFVQAGIHDGARITIETLLKVEILDIEGAYHSLTIPVNNTVGDLREKIQSIEKKRFFHMKFNYSFLFPDGQLLKFFGLQNDSVIELQSDEVPYIIVYNEKEYDIGMLDEHASFAVVMREVSGVISPPFNLNTYFECECSQILSTYVDEPHNALCSSFPRRLTAIKQMKLSIVDESGNMTHLIKPITSTFREVAVDIEDEDVSGIILQYRGEIVDNNKTLTEFFGNLSEAELQVRCGLTPKLTSCLEVPFPRLPSMHHPAIRRHQMSVIKQTVKTTKNAELSDSFQQAIGKQKNVHMQNVIPEQDDNETKTHDPPQKKARLTPEKDDSELISLTSELFVDIDECDVNAPGKTDSQPCIQILPPVTPTIQLKQCGTCDSLNAANSMSNSEESSSSNRYFTDNEAFRGKYPLHHAVETGNLSMTKSLLHTNEYSARDSHGRTALHVAAFLNNVKFLELLVEYGYDIEACEANGATALHVATIENSREAVQYLLLCKANLEAKMNDGTTPLMLAVKESHIEVAEILLKGGANMETILASGATVLYKAVQMNNIDMIHVLLRYGANPNSKLKSGTNCFFRAVQTGLYDVVKILLNSGASVHECMDNGATALHFAVRMNDLKMTKILIGSGAKLDAVAITSGTPLHIAVQHDFMTIAECLVIHGAEISRPWLDGTTPLHVASYNKRQKMAEFLIINKADCNASKCDGTTPLMIAAKENNTALVKLLLDNGADVNAVREDAMTACDIAQTLNFEGVVKLLKKNDANKSSKYCDVQ